MLKAKLVDICIIAVVFLRQYTIPNVVYVLLEKVVNNLTQI